MLRKIRITLLLACVLGSVAARAEPLSSKVEARLKEHSYATLVGRIFFLTQTEKLPAKSDSFIFDEFTKEDIIALSREAPLFPHKATIVFRVSKLPKNPDGTVTVKANEVRGEVEKAKPPVTKDGLVISTVLMTPSSLIDRIECEANRPLTVKEMAAMVGPDIQLKPEIGKLIRN